MELLRLNTPRYFAPEEAADLDAYLERERELYIMSCFTRRGSLVAAESILRTAGRSGKSAGTWCIRSIGENRWERGCCGIGSKNSKRCAASAESPSERRSWPSGFTKSGGSSSKGSKRTIGPKDSTCIAWNMSVGNKSRRRQALRPVGYGVLRRNGCGAQGFRCCRFGAEDAGKERVLRRVS